MSTTTLERPAGKKAFRVTHRAGHPIKASIPPDMTVAEAIGAIATRAGFPPEPSVSVRYALWARGPETGARPDEFTVLTDEVRFGQLAEGTELRVATQPRPARS